MTHSNGVKSTPRETYLPPEAITKLQRAAKQYAAIGHAKDRKEWYFAKLVNDAWDALDDEVRMEISRDHHYVECAWHMNDCLPFPIIGESGETLRRWCEVERTYRTMPAVENLKEILSFEHFRMARSLANKGSVNSPVHALAKAYAERWTADEMADHFDPERRIPPHEFDQVVGHLDSLQAAEFGWLSSDERRQVTGYLQAVRRIVEKKHE